MGNRSMHSTWEHVEYGGGEFNRECQGYLGLSRFPEMNHFCQHAEITGTDRLNRGSPVLRCTLLKNTTTNSLLRNS